MTHKAEQDEFPNSFIPFPRQLNFCRLSKNTKAVALEFMNQCHTDKQTGEYITEIKTTYDWITKQSGVPRGSIKKCIDQLVAIGFIKRRNKARQGKATTGIASKFKVYPNFGNQSNKTNRTKKITSIEFNGQIIDYTNWKKNESAILEDTPFAHRNSKLIDQIAKEERKYRRQAKRMTNDKVEQNKGDK